MGKAGPCRLLQDSQLSPKGKGKPLQVIKQSSDMIRFTFCKDHPGCTVENGIFVDEISKLAFTALYQLGPTYTSSHMFYYGHTCLCSW